jgi:hypothetical protein
MSEKSEFFFENLSIILIFAMFLSSNKKVQGPQKKLKGRMWPAGRTLATPGIEHTYDASHN